MNWNPWMWTKFLKQCPHYNNNNLLVWLAIYYLNKLTTQCFRKKYQPSNNKLIK